MKLRVITLVVSLQFAGCSTSVSPTDLSDFIFVPPSVKAQYAGAFSVKSAAEAPEVRAASSKSLASGIETIFKNNGLLAAKPENTRFVLGPEITDLRNLPDGKTTNTGNPRGIITTNFAVTIRYSLKTSGVPEVLTTDISTSAFTHVEAASSAYDDPANLWVSLGAGLGNSVSGSINRRYADEVALRTAVRLNIAVFLEALEKYPVGFNKPD